MADEERLITVLGMDGGVRSGLGRLKRLCLRCCCLANKPPIFLFLLLMRTDSRLLTLLLISSLNVSYWAEEQLDFSLESRLRISSCRD